MLLTTQSDNSRRSGPKESKASVTRSGRLQDGCVEIESAGQRSSGLSKVCLSKGEKRGKNHWSGILGMIDALRHLHGTGPIRSSGSETGILTDINGQAEGGKSNKQ